MTYAVGFLVFFLIAAIASMSGIGGGTMFVPVLLLMKYSFTEATTISLFLIGVTGFSAFLRYRKEHLVDWKLAIIMEIFTDLGAFVGGFTSVHYDPALLKIMFSILLVVIAFITIKVKLKNRDNTLPKEGFGYWKRNFNGITYSIPVLYMIPFIFGAGYLSGLLGIGGGAIKIPMMILWFNIPAKVAVATSALMVSITAMTGFGGHMFHERIDWSLTIVMAFAAFIGGQIGSRFSIKLPESKVKKTVGYVFIVLAIFMTLETIITGH